MMDDVIKEFLTESSENLDRMDRELVELEKNPGSQDLLGSIFRTIHTIKGTTGFLGFSKLEAVAHAGENLLSPLRDGKLELSQPITTGLLTMIDAIRGILSNIESTGNDGENAFPELVFELARLLQTGGAPRPGEDKSEINPVAASSKGDSPKSTDLAENSVRVDVTVLDQLMNLVGELVLARNRIQQFAQKQGNSEYLKTAQPLSLITTELRKRVMKARMQPVSNVFGKFPRVVRDVAMSCGKQVEIEIEGSDTELDRTIIDAVKDPLTHIIRNSVDHGIETPEARRACGKPVAGKLKLKANHEGGCVTIEITDDGAGIDRERVKQKAIEKALISVDQAARMNDHELLNLVFLPGFSTAAKVTNVSGRGVGMDVVKTNIDKVGGTVEINSKVGEGTHIKIKIPLTLTIIPALMVKSAGERFALPQVNLVELVKLGKQEIEESVEMVHNVLVCRLRNQLLPLVFLGSELTDRSAPPVAEDARKLSEIHIVVLHVDNSHFGLVVDGIEDTEEIVVKPLDEQLKGLNIFAGTTIRGNGEVALILDVLGLATRAHALNSNTQQTATTETAAATANLQSLLLFKAGDDGHFAIPASAIVRLEQVPLAKVERSNQQEVMRYRGEIMRLVDLPAALGRQTTARTQEDIQVLVCSHNGHNVGLVIDEIMDIVRDKIVHQENSSQRHVTQAIFGERVVDLLDMPGLLAEVIDNTFSTASPAGGN
jgi:two-component system chemotaxis sensor kinase CheA